MNTVSELAGVNWLHQLSPQLRQEILDCGRPRKFDSGAVVYCAADRPDSLFVIKSGSAYWTIARKSGQSLLLRIAREGDLFGEIVTTDSQPSPVFITARTDLQTIAIPQSDLQRFASTHPEVCAAIARGLARRLRGTLKIVEELALLPLPERARARLGRLALEADREAAGLGPVRLDITQTELSSMLGASRPATNKVLSALEQEEEITVHFKSLDVHPKLLQVLRDQ